MSDETRQKQAPDKADDSAQENDAVIDPPPLDNLDAAKRALQEAIKERRSAMEALDTANKLAADNLAGWHSANKTIDELRKEVERQQRSLDAARRRAQLAAAQKLESLIYAVDEFIATSPVPPNDIREHDWVLGVGMLQRKLEAALASHIDADSVFIELNAQRQIAFEDLAQEVAAAKLDDADFALAVETIDPAPGEPFDGSLHQAIGIDSSGAQESGTVAQTLRRGFRVGDFVLREALVMVAG